MDTTVLPPCRANTSVELGDESSLNWESHVQQPEPTGGRDTDTLGLSEIESSAIVQEDASRSTFDMPVNTSLPEAPYTTVERAHSNSRSDVADTEDNDSHGPLLISRQRQKRSHARVSYAAAQAYSPYMPRSRSHSTGVESTKVLRCRKGLHRRKGMRRDSPTPDSDDSSATPATLTSSRGTSERWPVQCFFQRRLVGSQEVITIEFPAPEPRAPSDRDAPRPSSDKTAVTAPVVRAPRGSGRRARFSEVEEDLLVELKERGHCWREIHRHFPNRTIGSSRCITARN